MGRAGGGAQSGDWSLASGAEAPYPPAFLAAKVSTAHFFAENILPLAESGDAAAQVYMSRLYYYGRGRAQDYAEALRWALARGVRSGRTAQHFARHWVGKSMIENKDSDE